MSEEAEQNALSFTIILPTEEDRERAAAAMRAELADLVGKQIGVDIAYEEVIRRATEAAERAVATLRPRIEVKQS